MQEYNKEVIEKINALEARVSKLEKREEVLPKLSVEATGQKKMTLKEFLISKKLSDDVKKTLVIGYFLEKFNGLASFTASDIENAFEHARETKPKNINDKINMNCRNGFMDEASEKKDSRKAWYITATGESFIENGFT